ncbi:MAG: hypothetical protein KKF41_08470 [Actinobacteria bacterium]|nr:hypothetical protein [Actinomycetota bacterium]MBU1942875.1 hypothetical protein [Actinomycetota bacterium]MBU2687607.1 hypothetical protein [Actinomycetota bacterium]
MSASRTENVRRVVCALAASLVLLACLPSPAALSAPSLEYGLKPSDGDPTVIEVTVSFDIKQGEQLFLRRFDPGSSSWEPDVEPTIEFEPDSNPAYSLEPLPDGSGWVVTGKSGGKAEIDYAVRFQTGAPPLKREDAPQAPLPPRYLFGDGLTVFRSHDAILSVWKAPGAAPLSDSATVRLHPPSGQKALMPWPLQDSKQGVYTVAGQEALFQQFITWGRLDTIEVRKSKPTLTAGFAGDYGGDGEDRQRYADALSTLYGDLEGSLGARPDADLVTVLVAPGSAFGIREPASDTMFQSVVLFTDGALEDSNAASATRALFWLWNGWTMLPRSGGGAEWFQQGMPWLYCYRVAARAGLMSGNLAYSGFSDVYAGYLEDADARTMSLSATEESGNDSLLRDKGAALCASIAVRLPAESQGATRDIDWLVGRVAEGFDALEGERYTLADISEILENATGRSWDKYFAGRVRGDDLIGADEFSSTDVFGVSTVAQSSNEVPRGSGKNAWILLIVAIVIILLIPVVLSAYVRRSVKLDLTMPKILPDDDFDDEGGDQPV